MVYRKVSSLFLSFFISLSMMLGVLSHNTFAAAGDYDSTVYLDILLCQELLSREGRLLQFTTKLRSLLH